MSVIKTEAELREIYGHPAGRAASKVLSRLETHCRSFIALSPFCLLATSDADGNSDVTPRGDAPGFVQVLEDDVIAIPDRPGNNRLDSLVNILANPKVGTIFMIPGVNETLRINGRAEISVDPDLMQQFEVQGKPPKSVILIHVEEAYLHCAKAFMRSKLWDPASLNDRSVLPSMGRMLKDQIGDGGNVESNEDMVARYKQNLY